jgi:Nitrile hydratase, alpha chain
MRLSAVTAISSESYVTAEADDVKIWKVIARAWTDPEFKNRLRTDLPGALLEMGIDPPQGGNTAIG